MILFQAFSTPWFLFTNGTNHHLVFFLLETFNNIIQYQFDGQLKIMIIITILVLIRFILLHFLCESHILFKNVHLFLICLRPTSGRFLFLYILQAMPISFMQSSARETCSINWQTCLLIQQQYPGLKQTQGNEKTQIHHQRKGMCIPNK